MHETDAVAVLFARELEQQRHDDASVADAKRASADAHRAGGASASFEAWLAHRARSIVARSASAETLAAAQALASRWSAVAFAAIVVAFAVGVASDAIGPAHRVNILAPPLLALLAWNLVVYLVLALRRLSTPGRAPRDGPLRRALAAVAERVSSLSQSATSAEGRALLAGFARSWAGSAREVAAARAAAVVHGAAAALVLGALCSMYLRGLALEYRAGWESTFLDAERVHVLLSLVLGPASQLSGIALPGVEQLAALRFSAGPGENAARWIHLYAITLVLAVVLPRTVLGLVAVRRARQLTRHFPLPLAEAYFERLHRVWSGGALSVRVLPYSYQLSPSQRAALPGVLESVIAPQVDLTLLDTAPLGAEDDLARWIDPSPPARVAPEAPQPLLVVLFALAATPEREHHGALLIALQAHGHGRHSKVLVDESGFRGRFRGQSLAARLEERRRAWRAVLGDVGAEPVFVDLERGANEPHTAGTPRDAVVPPTTTPDRS